MWEEELFYLCYHIWLWEKKMIKAQLYNWQSSQHQQQVFLLQASAATRNYLLTAGLQAGAWLLWEWGSGQMAAGGRGEEATAAGEGQLLLCPDPGSGDADAGSAEGENSHGKFRAAT